MKALAILLLSCVCAFGQAFSFSDPAFLGQQKAAAAGGGGGSGVPGVYSAVAAGDAAATKTISVTAVTGNTPAPLDVIYVDWYSGAVPTVTNNGTACTLLTTNRWTGDATGSWGIWYLPNPVNGSRTITATWPANPIEKTIQVITFTNTATSSIFNTVSTNYTAQATSTPMTNFVASGTDQVMFCGNSLADAPNTPQLGTGQNVILNTNCGTGTHLSCTWWKAGQSGTVSNWVKWTSTTDSGLGAVCIRRPP